MSQYGVSNGIYRPNAGAALKDALPPTTFNLMDDDHGFKFHPSDEPEMPPVLYGNIKSTANRIIDTFYDREGSTGVLLSGEKGSGKTLLVKLLSKMGREAGFPSITISTNYRGAGFNELIRNINQPALVLFDEFEKVYHQPEWQEQLLSLFDGIFSTKKLFLLTVNDASKIDTNFFNRPGRLYYHIKYDGLEDAFIRQYATEHLSSDNQKYVDEVVLVSNIVGKFNFDMLKSIIEEVNRYNESPKQTLVYLNITPDTGYSDFTVKVFINNVALPKSWYNGHYMYTYNVMSDDNNESHVCIEPLRRDGSETLLNQLAADTSYGTIDSVDTEVVKSTLANKFTTEELVHEWVERNFKSTLSPNHRVVLSHKLMTRRVMSLDEETFDKFTPSGSSVHKQKLFDDVYVEVHVTRKSRKSVNWQSAF